MSAAASTHSAHKRPRDPLGHAATHAQTRLAKPSPPLPTPPPPLCEPRGGSSPLIRIARLSRIRKRLGEQTIRDRSDALQGSCPEQESQRPTSRAAYLGDRHHRWVVGRLRDPVLANPFWGSGERFALAGRGTGASEREPQASVSSRLLRRQTFSRSRSVIDLGDEGEPAGRRPGLLRVPLSHLALVCGECSQNLLLLTLGHLEEVERSPKFGRDFIELGG